MEHEDLLPLLDHLAAAAPAAARRWRDWRVERIAGGANNLLYRATGRDADLAIKFTIRDARDRWSCRPGWRAASRPRRVCVVAGAALRRAG